MKSRRDGFTLVELLVVAVIGSIVLASIYQTLVIQEKSVRQSYAIVGTQQNVRTAIQVLTSDLREISATDADITQADSLSITYRALRKAGVICDSDTISGGWVTVAYWGDAFVSPDSVLVYADGPNPTSAADDRWLPVQVNGTAASTDCAGNPISPNVQRLTFNPALTLLVRPGGIIRSFVPVRYRIANNGNEGQLERAEGTDITSGVYTPLVEDLSTIANQGLRFRYWDSARVAMTGTNLTFQANRNTIARIQVKVRGSAIGGTTGNNREFTDSLVSNIYLRGNRKLQ